VREKFTFHMLKSPNKSPYMTRQKCWKFRLMGYLYGMTFSSSPILRFQQTTSENPPQFIPIPLAEKEEESCHFY